MAIAGVFYPGGDGASAESSVWRGSIDNLAHDRVVTISNWLGYCPIVVNASQLVPPLTRRAVAVDPSAPQVDWHLPAYPHVVSGVAPLRRACHYILGDPAPSPQTDPLVPTPTVLHSFYATPTGPPEDRWWLAYGDWLVPSPQNAQLWETGQQTVYTALELDVLAGDASTTGSVGVWLYPTVRGEERHFLWQLPHSGPGAYSVVLDLMGAAGVYVVCYPPASVACRLLGSASRLALP